MPARKVIVYITAENQLLMFRRPELPRAGLQVPGGTIEAGESPEQAALREACEETGLSDLLFEGVLGVARYVTRDPPGIVHERHFVHLSLARAEPRSWSHCERDPTGAARPPPFELFWEPLETAKPEWEMDVFLDRLPR